MSAGSSTSKWIRQSHRWLSMVFTLTVIANFVAMSQGTPPAWLTAKFKPAAAEAKLAIDGQSMRLFERRIERDQSLTFSSNTEDPKAACNMYVVFIAGNRPELRLRDCDKKRAKGVAEILAHDRRSSCHVPSALTRSPTRASQL